MKNEQSVKAELTQLSLRAAKPPVTEVFGIRSRGHHEKDIDNKATPGQNAGTLAFAIVYTLCAEGCNITLMDSPPYQTLKTWQSLGRPG